MHFLKYERKKKLFQPGVIQWDYMVDTCIIRFPDYKKKDSRKKY